MFDPWRDPTTHIEVIVNGAEVSRTVRNRMLLVHFLREELGLAGVRIGCDTTSCGACTVLLDDRPIKSCTLFVVQVGHRTVTTVEGLSGADGALHPIQEAFWEEHALQCGYCTSGFVMAAYGLLKRTPKPSESEVRVGISGNLCRCTGYANIVRAIERASHLMHED